ncbi:hypothetical protein Hdeb2414_s0008g00283051 [Helianthus debilis subsp. tardiflorus]
MSMLWPPQNPRGFPLYGYQGKAGYSLINVFDPKAGGAMVVATLPEGRPLWIDQIRNIFLHPTSESLAKYANTVKLETRKKKKRDKAEEKKVKEPVSEAPRKRPSNLSFLDYVFVSETLSGLDAGVKRSERDPDDDATLTEIVQKKRLLEDKKKELDGQAAAALAEKKSKLQKETTTAPSELEIDLGVFSAKAAICWRKCTYLLLVPELPSLVRVFAELIFLRLYLLNLLRLGLSTYPPPPPPRPDPKGKGDDVEVEQVREDVSAGVGGGGEECANGAETEMESSEATPHATVYTKRVPGSREGGPSGTRQSPEFQHIQGGSWDTYNPACDDLPHAPHWNLTRGSRIDDIVNCHEIYSLSLPLAERMFQKKCHRMDLLDDHIHAGVNFYATCQEIVREWQLMGEDTLEFEAAKKELAEEREKFNTEKKGLLGRVSDAEDKLVKDKQLNAGKQQEWEAACEWTNHEM